MSRSSARKVIDSEAVNHGFQIAPMIDVVFVIMLFFMVMAGSLKTERVLRTVLPGNVPQGCLISYPNVVIGIAEDGTVTLNDDQCGALSDTRLSELEDCFRRIVRDDDSRGTRTEFAIESAPAAKYERMIQVLNVAKAAKAKVVTFSLADE